MTVEVRERVQIQNDIAVHRQYTASRGSVPKGKTFKRWSEAKGPPDEETGNNLKRTRDLHDHGRRCGRSNVRPNRGKVYPRLRVRHEGMSIPCYGSVVLWDRNGEDTLT